MPYIFTDAKESNEKLYTDCAVHIENSMSELKKAMELAKTDPEAVPQNIINKFEFDINELEILLKWFK